MEELPKTHPIGTRYALPVDDQSSARREGHRLCVCVVDGLIDDDDGAPLRSLSHARLACTHHTVCNVVLWHDTFFVTCCGVIAIMQYICNGLSFCTGYGALPRFKLHSTHSWQNFKTSKLQNFTHMSNDDERSYMLVVCVPPLSVSVSLSLSLSLSL